MDLVERTRQLREEEEQKKQKKLAARPPSKVLYWTAKEGKSVLRFMPPWAQEKESPYYMLLARKVFTHWNISSVLDETKTYSFSCPIKTPYSGVELPKCLVCDKVRALYATKDPVDEEMAKNLGAKPTWYSNVVDLNDPVITQRDVDNWLEKQRDKTFKCPLVVGDDKVQVWSYRAKVNKQLEDLLADDGIDFTNFETGFDVTVKRTGTGRFDTDYTVKLNLKGATKFLPKNPATVKENINDLSRLNPFPDLKLVEQVILGKVDDVQAFPLPEARNNVALPEPSTVSGLMGKRKSSVDELNAEFAQKMEQ